MPALEKCPKCGASLTSDAPSGLCARCLMAAGLESDVDPAQDAGATTPHTPASGPRFVPPSPEQLASHFPQLEIESLIGCGGMGAVYKARQRELDRTVAVKILPPQLGEDPAFAERFTREARAMARLNHPHIVSIYDFGQTSSATGEDPSRLYYFVMEYVDGASLRQLLRAGEIQPSEALTLTSQICDALQYAHDEGVVHRDVKPENVLVDKAGRVKIADFGLAKLVFDATHEATLTGTAELLGTFRYMAPELIERTGRVDHRADIYALGIVLYELLTGEVPMGRFYPPSEKVQSDPRLDGIVLRALEREPNHRFQTAREVKAALDRIESLQSASSTELNDSTFASRWLSNVWSPTVTRAASGWVVACRLLALLVGFAGVMVACFMTWRSINIDLIDRPERWPSYGRGIAEQSVVGWQTDAGKLVALAFGLVVLHLIGNLHRLRWLGRTYAGLLLAGFAAIGLSAWSLSRAPELTSGQRIEWQASSWQQALDRGGHSSGSDPQPSTPREYLETLAAKASTPEAPAESLSNEQLIQRLAERGQVTLRGSYGADGPLAGLSLGIVLTVIGLLEFVFMYGGAPTRRLLGSARSSFSSRISGLRGGEAQPRISKMAVLSAALALLPIAPCVILLAGAMQWVRSQQLGYPSGLADADIMLTAAGFMIGLSIFPTAVGSLALYRIRRWNGVLHGLPLAFAATIAWPLILFDVLVITVAMNLVSKEAGALAFFIILSLASSVVAAVFAWHAARRPLLLQGSAAEDARPTSSQSA